MDYSIQKKSAAALSIVSNSLIILLKFIIGLATGSVSVISEAVHSMSDFFASALTFFCVIKSAEPADKDHPFGHGKYEDMSGFIEGGLIIFAALFIIYEAVKKMVVGSDSSLDITWGLVAMGVSVVVNIVVSHILLKVAKKTESVSLYADAEHLRADVFSSLGVFIGLIVIKFTGLKILDSIIAILVACFIFKTGFEISKKTMDNLLDCSLPEVELNEIYKFLDSYKQNKIIGYKNLKARRLGAHKELELTLMFPNDMTIYDCHTICDEIEIDMKNCFGDISATIHLEPENIQCCANQNC